MITVGMNYRVLPGKGDVFEAAFARIAAALATMAGHTQSKLYRHVGGDGEYLILSEWSSRDAFDAFVRSDAFARTTDWGKQGILAERPRHQIYER
jgi:heme-degrading monooxygenase HmoA